MQRCATDENDSMTRKTRELMGGRAKGFDDDNEIKMKNKKNLEVFSIGTLGRTCFLQSTKFTSLSDP
jgi:hypothetical protein